MPHSVKRKEHEGMKNKKVAQFLAGLMAVAVVLTATPVTASAAAKSVTVSTQAQLEAALKNPKVTAIVIKTAKGTTFKVKAGDYENKKLVIAAPNATVNNYGDFKKVSIHDAKVVYDRGVSNDITVSDKNTLKLVAGKQSYESDITITSSGAKITIVNNGEVNAIKVKGKSDVTVRGNAQESPVITNDAQGTSIVAAMDAAVVLNKAANVTVKSGATLESLTTKADSVIRVEAGTTIEKVVIDGAGTKVALTIDGKVEKVVVEKKADVSVSGATTSTVAVENNAAGATIVSEVKADVSLNADAKVSFEKGAEGSTVKTEAAGVKAEVSNNTEQKVTLTDENGRDSTIDIGGTTDEATPDGGSGGGSAGGSTGGSGGGSTGGTTDESKITVGAIEMHDLTTLYVTMDEVAGARFTLDDDTTALSASHDGTKYTVTVANTIANGTHTLKLATDEKSGGGTFTYDATPVLSGADKTENVFASDVSGLAEATVTDTKWGQAVTAKWHKDSADGEELTDLAAAKAYLDGVDKTVVCVFTATAPNGAAATRTMAYVYKEDVTPTKVVIKNDGAVKVGHTLTADLQDDNGAPAGGGTFTYQWKVCATSDGSYEDVSGATSASYEIPGEGAEKFYKVEVKYTSNGEQTLTSDATTAVLKGTLVPDGAASYSEELANDDGSGSAPDQTKLTATFKNDAGKSVAVTLAFADDSGKLTANGEVSFTATATGYEDYTAGKVTIQVKGAKPKAEDVALVTDADALKLIDQDKAAFTKADAALEYHTGDNEWKPVTADPFSATTSTTVSVRRKATASNTASDVFTISVAQGNLGTKKIQLAAVSMSDGSIVLGENPTLSGTVTDENEAGVSGYEIQIWDVSANEKVASADVTGKTVTDQTLTLESGKEIAAGKAYTVSVLAKTSDAVKYEPAQPGAGQATKLLCEITFTLDSGEFAEDAGVKNSKLTVDANSAITDLPEPTKTEFIFKGWKKEATDENVLEGTEKVTTSITLIAVWEAEPEQTEP